jgi:nitrogen fixation protein NifU and related proteins
VGSLADPSGKAVVKSPVDSDTVQITLQIEAGVVRDVKFKCMGCAVAIACSSMATEMVMGKSVEEAFRISEQAVADALGGIPEYKMRCSNLAPDAIRRAISDWRSRQPVPPGSGT